MKWPSIYAKGEIYEALKGPQKGEVVSVVLYGKV